MAWHPDRHSSSAGDTTADAARAKMEERFKRAQVRDCALLAQYRNGVKTSY